MSILDDIRGIMRNHISLLKSDRKVYLGDKDPSDEDLSFERVTTGMRFQQDMSRQMKQHVRVTTDKRKYMVSNRVDRWIHRLGL